MTDFLSKHAFLTLPNLASARLGSRVLAANDEFFAAKENLVQDAEAKWDAERYTDRGKWMDGWESRRRREEGHDWCLLKLAVPGILHGAVVDTSHFRGNFPESCSLDACAAPGDATPQELLAPETEWLEILPRTPLEGDARLPLPITAPYRFSHVRLNIYPDGGVARLRLHGRALPDAAALAGERPVPLSALELGARIVAVSDSFFGPADRLLLSDPPTGMHDGWETRRRRGSGNDWVVVQLAAPGSIEQLEVDTSFFKGNAPGSCSVEAASCEETDPQALADGGTDVDWRSLLASTPIDPDRHHVFDALQEIRRAVTHVRLQIYPDGGVARFRVLGRVAARDRQRAAVVQLDSIPPAAALRTLLDCCGSTRWAAAMVECRPFGDAQALFAAAEDAAALLGPDDWLQAFAAHPPIGGDRSERPRSEQAHAWSRQEQAAVTAADAALHERLAAANRRYQERFGHLCIVNASGKSAEEILTLIEGRLANDPEEELCIAAREERAITRHRLEKRLGGP